MNKFLLTGTLVLAAAVSQAQVRRWTAVLTGGQENPPVSTAATGTGELFVNTATGRVWGNIITTNLSSAVTDYHVHQGAVGVNGPVRAWVRQAGNMITSTASSWRVDFDLMLTQRGGTPAAGVLFNYNGTGTNGLVDFADVTSFVAALDSGLGYYNVHTTNFGPGEIRGQLVPEPGTMAALGLGGLALLRRRRAKKA